MAKTQHCFVVRNHRMYVPPGGSRYNPVGLKVFITGFERDIERLQMLFTSLLVQCDRAMFHAPQGHNEVTEFRRGFITGFFSECTNRLELSTKVAEKKADEETDGRFLPALIDKDEMVEQAVAAKFGELRSVGSNSVNASGWNHGKGAGANADIGNARVGNRKELPQ